MLAPPPAAGQTSIPQLLMRQAMQRNVRHACDSPGPDRALSIGMHSPPAGRLPDIKLNQSFVRVYALADQAQFQARARGLDLTVRFQRKAQMPNLTLRCGGGNQQPGQQSPPRPLQFDPVQLQVCALKSELGLPGLIFQCMQHGQSQWRPGVACRSARPAQHWLGPRSRSGPTGFDGQSRAQVMPPACPPAPGLVHRSPLHRQLKLRPTPDPGRPANPRRVRCPPTGAARPRRRRPCPVPRARAGGAWYWPGAWPGSWRRRC